MRIRPGGSGVRWERLPLVPMVAGITQKLAKACTQTYRTQTLSDPIMITGHLTKLGTAFTRTDALS
jgi:hypothetical protein